MWPGSESPWVALGERFAAVSRLCRAVVGDGRACLLRGLLGASSGVVVSRSERLARCDFESGIIEAPDERKQKVCVCVCVFVPDLCPAVMPGVLSEVYSACRQCLRHRVTSSMNVRAIHALSSITRSIVGRRVETVTPICVSFQCGVSAILSPPSLGFGRARCWIHVIAVMGSGSMFARCVRAVHHRFGSRPGPTHAGAERHHDDIARSASSSSGVPPPVLLFRRLDSVLAAAT